MASPSHAYFALLLSALFFPALASCDKGEETPAVDDARSSVRVAVVTQATAGEGSSHLIFLAAEQRAEISARFGGQIKGIEVVDQQEVEEGQLLFQLADADSRGSLQSARAAVGGATEQLKDRKRELERSKSLAERGIDSDRNVEALESNATVLKSSISQARGSYVSAKDRLAAAKIEAPFAGVVTRLDAELGEYAAPGAALMVLSDLKALVIDVPLTENEVVRHDQGGLSFQVKVRGKVREHELLWVSAEADVLGSFTARLRIDNAEAGLRAGETAKIIVASPVKSDAMVLDPRAVRWEGDQAYVFALDAGDVLSRIDVEVFEGTGIQVRVEGQLEVGQRIAAAGPSTMVEGDRVRVVED